MNSSPTSKAYLRPNESGITLPVPLPHPFLSKSQSLELTAKYEVGTEPGMRIAEYLS